LNVSISANRRALGLPDNWATVHFWLTGSTSAPATESPNSTPKPKRFPNIPKLSDYSRNPLEAFWKNFPFNPIPAQPETKIIIANLEKIIDNNEHLMLKSELNRAKKCGEYLSSGAPSFQSAWTTGCAVPNSTMAFIHGPSVTDTIASWVEKKFVAGPFSTPPVPNFRANSILAVPQASKTRICINVSLPKSKSFNDNVRKVYLERVKMSSARLFGYSIVEAGENCSIAKHDMEDAYKNVPAKIDDLRHQGFTWLGKHFVELRQMFGAASSVRNFDILANTVKTLALAKYRIPSRFVHRQLDEVPLVAPANSGWATEFYKTYREICDSINLELAKESPDLDKAFGCSKKGKFWESGSTLMTYSNLVPSRRQKIKDSRRNYKGKKPAALLPETNANSGGQTQLHLIHVPIPKYIQTQPQ
jgi:hypothetical protein